MRTLLVVRLFDNRRAACFLRPAVVLALVSIFLVGPLHAQVQWVSDGFFPAALEFKEIKSVQAEKDLKESADLAKLEFGPAFIESGLRRYGERIFALADAGNLFGFDLHLWRWPCGFFRFDIIGEIADPDRPAGRLLCKRGRLAVFGIRQQLCLYPLNGRGGSPQAHRYFNREPYRES